MRIRFDSSFDWKNQSEAAFKKRYSIIHSNRDVGQYAFGTHEVNLKIFIGWALQNKSFEIPNQLLTGTGVLPLRFRHKSLLLFLTCSSKLQYKTAN
jgi:hypothetical protein